MPIPDDVADALAAEALEKAAQRQGPGRVSALPGLVPGFDMRMTGDERLARLHAAADMVGASIDARHKADVAVQAAIRMFIAEFAATVSSTLPGAAGGGRDGAGKSAAAASSAMERLRTQGPGMPKTFGAKNPERFEESAPHNPTHEEKL